MNVEQKARETTWQERYEKQKEINKEIVDENEALRFAVRMSEKTELQLRKENAELKKEVEKHKWNDIFLEDCTGYDKKIAEEYTTLQERIKELEKENAELKAGNRWHDLRKDPKDVPDEGTYLVVWQNARGYRERMIMRYEEDDEEELHWIDGEGDNWDDDVIAWREIPKFEEAA